MERLTRYFYENSAGVDCEKCGRRKTGKCNTSADCAQTVCDRLASIEDILGDDYDLDRLKVLVNQCMTMREEVAERFSITKDIPVNTLREMVNSPYWMSPVCVGCPGKTEDGHRTEKCGYPDDMTLCEERQKRLFELVDADREGRCYITTVKIGESVFLPNEKGEIVRCRVQGISLPVHGKDLIIHLGGYPAEYLWTDREGKDWWKTREAAEAALKGETHDNSL